MNEQYLSGVLDGAPIGSGRLRVIVLCFAILMMEGFDAAIVGFVAPRVAADLGIATAKTSLMMAAGMMGLMLGYLLGGPLSDRMGRRPVLLAGTTAFGLASLACAISGSLTAFVSWRLITGLGMGIAMPAIVALLAELLPRKRRASSLTGVFCGFLFGSALAGLLTGQLIGSMGWAGLVALGGVLPLLCVPVAIVWLPESPLFLATRGAPAQQVLRALDRLGFAIDSDAAARTPPPSTTSVHGSVRWLFSPTLRLTTLLLWPLMFLVLASFYVIASWLPTLLHASGIGIADASRTAALFQSGGLVGAISAALAVRRISPFGYASLSLLLGAVMPLALANPTLGSGYAALVFCAGFLISGPIVVIGAASAMVYPTAVRAIGGGWAASCGRLGSVAGVGSVGWLVQQGLELNQVVAGISMAVLACSSIAWGMSRIIRNTGV